jgi:hypothetical protein
MVYENANNIFTSNKEINMAFDLRIVLKFVL